METRKTQEADGIVSEQEAPKVTVGYERQIAFPNAEGVYGANTAKTSVFVQADIDLTADDDEIQAKTEQALDFAKGRVFETLGVDWEIDAQTNRVVEVLQQELAAAPQAQTSQRSSTPKGKPSPEDLWRDLISDPSGWWDNRESATGKQPHFKKVTSKENARNAPALWIDSKPDGLDIPEPSEFKNG